MNKNPRFSVIIPLYNKAHTILRTLNTVLCQTYTDFEIVIIDDGSTDNGAQIIESSLKDARVNIVRQNNKGVSAARNRGVKESKGDYIAFLDADDEWLPSYLEKVVEAIEKFPCHAIYNVPALHRDIETGFGLYIVIKKYANKIVELDMFDCPFKICSQSSGIVVNRDTFYKLFENYKGHGFPEDQHYNEDMVCYFTLGLFGKCVYVGYPLSIRNNNVKGQLTGDVGAKYTNRILNETLPYINKLYANYKIYGKMNEKVERFIRWDTRNQISCICKSYDKEYLHNFLKGLDEDLVKKLFSKVEMFFYEKCNSLTLCRLLTKILRLRWHFKSISIKMWTY